MDSDKLMYELIKGGILESFEELFKLDPGSLAFNQLFEQVQASFESILTLLGPEKGRAYLDEWLTMWGAFLDPAQLEVFNQWLEEIWGNAGKNAEEGKKDFEKWYYFIKNHDFSFFGKNENGQTIGDRIAAWFNDGKKDFDRWYYYMKNNNFSFFGKDENGLTVGDRIAVWFEEGKRDFDRWYYYMKNNDFSFFGKDEAGQTTGDRIAAWFNGLNTEARQGADDWKKYSDFVESTGAKAQDTADDTFDLNTELANQVYLVSQLSLAYENWLGYTFDQYDEYLRQLGRFDKEGVFDPSGPLFTALQRLLDFGIDLDDTNVDEQIAVWIRQVQTFLETLDPDSAAYQALKAALDELIQKFIAMGGSIEAAFDSTVRLQDKLKGLKNVAMPQIGVGPIPGGGGGFHTGGLVTAHNGLLNSGDEVMAKLQRGEVVINRAVVNQYGANAFMELNRTGSMGGFQESNQQSENHVYVDIHNAGPMAFAEVTEQVYPRIKDKQRNYEPGRNPYSQ